MLAAAALCAVSVLSIPPAIGLGYGVRLAMFHGASTWVNMATFTLAGAAGAAYLLGRTRLRAWGEAFRWVSLPLWTVNTVLGIVSMKVLWGAILWDEPRLLMSFGLLGGALVVFAVQMIFDSPRHPAVLDGLLAATLWVLVLVLPNLFHPDSPVFASGDEYLRGFCGMVGSPAVSACAGGGLLGSRRQEVGEIVIALDE
jgi:hypothetical protein